MPNFEFDSQQWLKQQSYEPIADYAVVGDCNSAALISRRGSIDWFCLPDFSSPSVFGALLDRRKGGRLFAAPRQIKSIVRRYIGRSAVLETTFHCDGGSVVMTDFMPMPAAAHERCLIRTIECVRGVADVEVLYQPRPDYARASVSLQPLQSGWRVQLSEGSLALETTHPLLRQPGCDVAASVWSMRAGQRASIVVHYSPAANPQTELPATQALLEQTRRWWEDWCGRCIYSGDYPDAVMRSCMALKLLTHQHTGAVMAALTTSLPESMEGGRNWDYRFCWLRDTSLLLQSFLDMGFRRESGQFLSWLLNAGRSPRLQPFYNLRGHPAADEIALHHLEGWRGCGPVNIGNSAHGQLQLDIYGELILTAYRFVCKGGELNAHEKKLLVDLGGSVQRYWRKPDQGIWETRGPPRHHTYSKVMCWVALDRLLKLNQSLGLGLCADRIARERNEIRAAIDGNGYNAALGCYVGSFGGAEPDASLLLMLRYGYLNHDDPRSARTFRFIVDRLGVDGLLYRYPQHSGYDGVSGAENLFVACNFWVVDHLARSGEIDAAIQVFERLLGYANDVGFYAEQFAVWDGSALGNFPQAFSHSGLITAAIAIEEARRGRRGAAIAS